MTWNEILAENLPIILGPSGLVALIITLLWNRDSDKVTVEEAKTAEIENAVEASDIETKYREYADTVREQLEYMRKLERDLRGEMAKIRDEIEKERQFRRTVEDERDREAAFARKAEHALKHVFDWIDKGSPPPPPNRAHWFPRRGMDEGVEA